MLTQTFTSPENWYTLEYPRVWEMEVVDNIPAFYDPFSGKGALQILSVKISGESTEQLIQAHPFLGGNNLHEKMKIFLHMNGAPISADELTEVHQNGVDFIPCEYMIDSRFYMCVMIQKNEIFLLCLYNSDGIPDDEEAKIIGNIIQSVQIIEN